VTPPPHEVCDSSDQAAHYHLPGLHVGDLICDDTCGWPQNQDVEPSLDETETQWIFDAQFYFFLILLTSFSGLEIREYGLGDALRWPRDILYPQNVAINFADKLRTLGRYSSLAD
jgi:hypothetical protein